MAASPAAQRLPLGNMTNSPRPSSGTKLERSVSMGPQDFAKPGAAELTENRALLHRVLREKQQLIARCAEQKQQLLAAQVDARLYRQEISTLESAGLAESQPAAASDQPQTAPPAPNPPTSFFCLSEMESGQYLLSPIDGKKIATK